MADPLELNWRWFDQGGKWGWTKIPLHQCCNCRLCGRWRSWDTSRRRERHQEQRMAREALKGGDWD
jgi:hypothetical protein